MQTYFFGYGSLVHRGTHRMQATRARLTGWRRCWRAMAHRDLCYLTVVPDAGARIDGLVLSVPQAELAALDAREAAYGRVDAGAGLRHPGPVWHPVWLYAIAEGRHRAPGTENPILLSYLDVVIGGLDREFGAAGVAAFWRDTAGWTTIMDDRQAPRYPRAQVADPRLCDATDARIEAMGLPVRKDGDALRPPERPG